jgi:hypothetical protein
MTDALIGRGRQATRRQRSSDICRGRDYAVWIHLVRQGGVGTVYGDARCADLVADAPRGRHVHASRFSGI